MTNLMDGNTLDPVGFQKLLCYRWYPDGRPCIKNYKMDGRFTNQEIATMLYYVNNPISFNPEMLFDLLDTTFARIGNVAKRVVVPISGGCDSAYTLVKCLEHCEKVYPVTLDFLNYNEVENAQKVCDDLGVGLEAVGIDQDCVIKDFPLICKQMEVPLERGSFIPSWYYYKYAHSMKSAVVSGEMADCCFAPSMPYTLNVNSNTDFNDLEYKIDEKIYYRLFGEIRPRLWFYDTPDLPPIYKIMVHDILHELPYYYQTRYKSWEFLADSYSAFQDPYVLSASLGMRDLHTEPGKKVLRHELEKYLKDKSLAYIPKGIFKIEPFDYQDLVDQHFPMNDGPCEPFISLMDTNFFLHDWPKLKEAGKQLAWSKLLISIFDKWLQGNRVVV